MFDMYVINSADNRQAIRNLGIKLGPNNGTTYIHVYLEGRIAVYSIFALTEPLFEVETVAVLMQIPEYKAQIFYLLSSGIISRFNPHIGRDVLAEYYASRSNNGN